MSVRTVYNPVDGLDPDSPAGREEQLLRIAVELHLPFYDGETTSTWCCWMCLGRTRLVRLRAQGWVAVEAGPEPWWSILEGHSAKQLIWATPDSEWRYRTLSQAFSAAVIYATGTADEPSGWVRRFVDGRH